MFVHSVTLGFSREKILEVRRRRPKKIQENKKANAIQDFLVLGGMMGRVGPLLGKMSGAIERVGAGPSDKGFLSIKEDQLEGVGLLRHDRVYVSLYENLEF
jgi:hypothetical protein